MSEAVLQVDRLTAGYGQVPVIRDVSFAVAEGQVVALLGPNGAGKTTTLLAAVGLLPMMAGSVVVKGYGRRKLRASALARSGVALIPDDRGLCPGLTVKEHFRLVQRRRSREREDAALETFPQLRDIQGRKAGLLSGGEQQMLTIAKALLSEPRLLLIDEMSLGLAPKVVREMFPAIRRLARARNIGVLLVEQHIEVALSVADRALVLNRGSVVLDEPAEVLLRDRDRVQAAYFDDTVATPRA
ncbi:ABC transporter ATP-binding protein [Georgenia sp. SYP-B2076]|uniref:ABC transporter ATP-binding protein n=1 Tax=Georgenia sp. SYP-B2076 TaxID=2495881 RepID=UPI000F8D1272|nr:ABC transporter ATP-binding protein [Georgenia sp. SYP-B2076]